MCANKTDFESYFKRRLKEDSEIIKKLPTSIEELRNIYRQEFEATRHLPTLELKMDPQELDYETVNSYLPEKWEMPRSGKLLHSNEELFNVLKLLIYNLGVKKSLDTIPLNLIEEYLNKTKEKEK